MSRNRRKVEGEVTLSWVLAKVVMLLLLVGVFLGITILKSRNMRMGDEVRSLDRDLSRLEEVNQNLQAQLARYKTPREIENRLARLHVTMVHPTESQIRRLPDPDQRTLAMIRPKFIVQSETTASENRYP